MSEKKKSVVADPSPKTKKPKKVAKDDSKFSVEKKDNTSFVMNMENHFKETWQLFKKTFLSYLKLIGIGIILLIGLILLGLIIITPLMISLGGSVPGFFSNPSPLQIVGLLLLVLLGIGAVAVFVVFFLFLAIGGIFILSNQKRLSIGELFKRTKPLILPYLFVSIIVGFITTGGWFVFIIPGLLFSLLFIFVSYVVILEKKSEVAALKRSYALVRANFWNVLFRILVIQVIIFAGSYFFETLAEENDTFSLLSFVFSITAGWFAQVYMYLLYKQLAKSSTAVQTNLRWVWIVAILGWLLAIGFLIAIGTMQTPDLLNSLDLMDIDAPLASETN